MEALHGGPGYGYASHGAIIRPVLEGKFCHCYLHTVFLFSETNFTENASQLDGLWLRESVHVMMMVVMVMVVMLVMAVVVVMVVVMVMASVCGIVDGWLSVGGARVNGPINPLFSQASLLAGLGCKVIANQAGPVKLTAELVGLVQWLVVKASTSSTCNTFPSPPR